ncbi:MAG: hypothetical protein SOT81_10930 [Treponema sp.]|nr:hypothetical protein [Treponema sp.]
MYLNKLFNLARKYPALTDKNLTAIDNFFGSIGTNNIFTVSQFKSVLTQKGYAKDILAWLVENDVISPYEIECSQCHKLINFYNEKCPYCQCQVDKQSEYISEYKIIENLFMSSAEIEQNKNKSLKLYKVSFDLLLKKLDKKYEKKESSFIIFADIKSSTQLKKINPIYHDKICRGVVQFFKELSIAYLLQSKGIYIKSEGDASFVILDSIESVYKFLFELIKTIYSTEFFRLMNTVNMEKKRYEDENNKNHTFFTFLKIYVAGSETGKYSQKDVLSIDFDAMEAFTYIKRIEKKVKEQVLENQDYLQLCGNFPICVFSRENLFNSTSISIKNIDDYGDENIYYSTANEVKKYLEEKFD